MRETNEDKTISSEEAQMLSQMGTTCLPKSLTEEEKQCLEQQNTRLISDHKSQTLEKNARKYWDLFYKRNETRFFKDRHWTTREFTDLLGANTPYKRILLEVGCGVGNFIFPLIKEGLNFHVLACDLSSKAIEIVQKHELYNSENMRVFQTDVTTEDILSIVEENSVDIVTLIFVLSAVHPEKFLQTLKNLYRLLKPGGLLLMRDYGLYDMAQLRFKAGHKISDNFYMRQDGTRSYYFSTDFLASLFEEAGYQIVENSYVHRRTVNKKENIDVPRIFVQSKVMKPVITVSMI